MLLAVDIGNTNTTFGIFHKGRLFRKFDLPTGKYDTQKLRSAIGAADIRDSIICSVVPAAAVILSRNIRLLTGRRPYIIGKDIKAPIKNLYRKRSQVGQDRLVNAYAAIRFYGAPAVVVDFGTAVTFDVISKQGAYLGGLILPGLQLGLDALGERTALLPSLKLAAPRELIGRDTKNSILSGVTLGMSSAVDELCRRIKKVIGRNAQVIGTGGNAAIVRKFCKEINHLDKDLTLKGINLIFCAGTKS